MSSSQGISSTAFDMCGLGCLGHPDTDHVRCSNCKSQGALDKYGKPAYANFHYGIRFGAVEKCPTCNGRGQHHKDKNLKEFIKRILDENPNIDPTKETDFFRRKVWEGFFSESDSEELDTVEIDSVLYETISEKISEEVI